MTRAWRYKSDVSKHWKDLDPDTVTKEELNEAIVAIAKELYEDPFFNGIEDGEEKGNGLFSGGNAFTEVIEELEWPGIDLCMEYVEDVEDFDSLLSELYDYADAVRIWIEPV